MLPDQINNGTADDCAIGQVAHFSRLRWRMNPEPNRRWHIGVLSNLSHQVGQIMRELIPLAGNPQSGNDVDEASGGFGNFLHAVGGGVCDQRN